MNIRFSDDLLSDLRAIAGALRLLFLFGLGIILLFLIFYWDALCSRPFIEAGPTELVQTLFLVLSTALFFLEAHRRREMRWRATISALACCVRWRDFPVLLVGIVIVLAYSRLFGMGILWDVLIPEEGSRMAKNAMEESSELLGYMFILASALLLRFEKH